MQPNQIKTILADKGIKRYSTVEMTQLAALTSASIKQMNSANFEKIETRLIKTRHNSSSDEKSDLAKELLLKFQNWQRGGL